jgi:YegS/Rv2252/BmrU family lipid kinase
MKICVIFNPAARGEKARSLSKNLDLLSRECSLKPTQSAGMARALAAEAVREGFETIVAAGGDGTLNEVLNGVADVPEGLARTRLAVLPLGTINVFAREINFPLKFQRAWQMILQGRETRIDLPQAEFVSGGRPEQRYFIQLAGAGLDATACQKVNWELKKKWGKWSYIVAGLQALRRPQHPIQMQTESASATGQLVLLGNGRFYGGHFEVFPRADLRDGRIHLSVFPRVHLGTLARYACALVTNLNLGIGEKHFSAETVSLTSEFDVALQLDGEYVGRLPAKFKIEKQALRVIVP